jgi:hypothetical protein
LSYIKVAGLVLGVIIVVCSTLFAIWKYRRNRIPPQKRGSDYYPTDLDEDDDATELDSNILSDETGNFIHELDSGQEPEQIKSEPEQTTTATTTTTRDVFGFGLDDEITSHDASSSTNPLQDDDFDPRKQ